MRSIDLRKTAYILTFLGLQAGAHFVAPYTPRQEVLHASVVAVLLIPSAFFLRPQLAGALAAIHFFAHYMLPFLVEGRITHYPWMAIANTVGVSLIMLLLTRVGNHQRMLVAQLHAAKTHASEAHRILRAILDNTPNQVVVKDADLRYTYVNPAFLAYYGWHEGDVIGRRFVELVDLARSDRFETLDRRVLATGKPLIGQLERVVTAAGEIQWYKLSKMPIYGDDRVDQVLTIMVDVTELQSAQDALAQTVGLLETLAGISARLLAEQDMPVILGDILPVAGSALHAGQVCLYRRAPGVSGSGQGATQPLLLQNRWTAPPEESAKTGMGVPNDSESTWEPDAVLPSLIHELEQGDIFALPLSAESDTQPTALPDRNIPHAWFAPILVDEHLWGVLVVRVDTARLDPAEIGSFLRTLATNLGVAMARSNAQNANARERNLLRTLIDNAPDFVYIKDADLRYIVANRAFVEVMGLQSEEALLGKRDSDIHPPDVAARVRLMDLPILHGETPIRTEQEEVILPLTGESRWMLTTKAPFRNRRGEIIGLITISRDVTAMKDVENHMREAKEVAEMATRAKSEFLANMSHEIRTPMNGVIGMTSLLLRTDLRPDQREFVETIRTSSDDLLLILNDILDYSKIESGNIVLDQKPFNPVVAVEDVLDLHAGRRQSDAVAVTMVAEANVPHLLLGDVTRLRQILGNLVANALKFTSAGEVAVHLAARSVDATHTQLEIAVRDTGIGIPAEHLDRLFQSFSQGDSSITRRFGGTGLGLAISKRLVELMNGTISVESVERAGSTFHVHIILEQVVEYGAQGLPARKLPGATAYSACHFVVGDANSYSRDALAAQLRAWGATVACAANVDQLRRIVTADKRIGLILCDVAWLAAVQESLAQSEPRGPVAIVLITSNVQEEPNALAHMSSLKNGGAPVRSASATITRPVTPSDLAATVERVLVRSHPGAHVMAAVSALPQLSTELPARILLVEDNLVNQRVATRMLERLGYTVALAGNGREAVESVRVQPFDVIFMDVHMPEMDGHTATRLIRADIETVPRPYIIAMTADAMPGYREECLAAGMDDYIAKPVRIEDLTAAMRRFQHRRMAAR